eukprot:974980-Pleurochrysis_carterae.AAC.2
MDGSHDTGGACSVLVRQGREGGDELPHMHGCFGFVAHKVHGLEASVVIHEYEGVLKAAVHCAHKGASYVSVHKSACVRWLAAHPSNRPRARAGGASAVIEGSARKRKAPAYSLRCM